MDRLHVATLNILNLADRWPERLPLLLADMAALQPDLIGLQEVVYVMQQDRLIGAAGRGGTRAIRGWAGRPEYGNSLLVKEPLAATQRRPARPRTRRSAHRVGRRPARRREPCCSSVTHLHHAVDGEARARRPGRARCSAGWTARRAADAHGRRGRLQRRSRPSRPTRGCARAGFRSAYAEANGAEPAVTWPSGLQAPAMDTDGDPDCLDYIWVRGAVRVDRRAGSPSTGRTRRRSDALPERPPRHQRAPRDRVAGDAGPCPHAPARPSRRLAARPGEQHRGDAGRAGDPGLRRARVRRPALVRRHPGAHPRRDARAGPGQPGPRRRAAGGGPRDARHPDAGDAAGRGAAAGVPRRRAQGRRTTGPSWRCWRPARGADLRDAVVSSFEPATLERVRGLAPAWPRWLNSQTLDADVIATAAELDCRGVSVWFAGHRRRDDGAWPGRPGSRWPRGPSGGGPPTIGWPGSGVAAVCVEAAALDG